MLHLESLLFVPPFMSLREVPTGFFLPTQFPAIPSPLPCSGSLFDLCKFQLMARTSVSTPLPPSVAHHRPTTTHRTLARERSLDKAGLQTTSPALYAYYDSPERPTESGPQEPSAVSLSASRVARTNSEQVPAVSKAPSRLHVSSQTALPSLVPSGITSSQTRCHQVSDAGKLAVGSGFSRSDPAPSTDPPPAPPRAKPRPLRPTLASEVYPRPSIGPVPSVPILHAADAAAFALPVLGALPPEAPRRVSTRAALLEIPSRAVEFIESFEYYSHSRTEPV